MQQTYRAVLYKKDQHLEWKDPPPSSVLNEDSLEVEVTIRSKPKLEMSQKERGEKIVALFQELAKSDPFADIEDPVAWQREIRKDRPLPFRD